MAKTKTVKSLKLNMALYALKYSMTVFLPLITYPYVTDVLGVECFGKYNFSSSIIYFFLLFSGLGISTYAVREGARVRDDQADFSQFASQMWSINMIFTIISYLVLGIMLIFVQEIKDYKELLLILSIQILFKTIGVEWIYSIYEDFCYITICTFFFQILSVILLFSFVKNEQDIYLYAFIMILSSVGSSLVNLIHSHRYCKLHFIFRVDWEKHLKPIFVLFAMSLTVSIYTNSDTIFLGFMCGDYYVGLYSIPVKIYSVIKILLSSVLTVAIPRMSALIDTKANGKFGNIALDTYRTLLTVTLPAIFGVVLMRKELLLLFFPDYLESESALVILCIALVFSLTSWFWAHCVLIPAKKDNVVFKAAVLSAITNIVLNIIFLPVWKEKAAALTTVIAELIAYIWCSYEGKKIVRIPGVVNIIVKNMIGCMCIFGVVWLMRFCAISLISRALLSVIFSVFVYFISQVLLKNIIFNKI